MTELFDALHVLGTWSTAALWLPLLAWTLLALPIYGMIRHADDWHPLTRYRLLQALLFTLPVGLVATAWVDLSSLLAGWTALSPSSPGGTLVPILPAEGAASGSATPTTGWDLDAYHAAGLLTLLAGGIGIIRLIRLVRSRHAVARLHAQTVPGAQGLAHRTALRLARTLGVRRPVTVRLSDDAVVPLTYGTRRPVILLPRALTDRPDALRMTLTHELVHVRRRDVLARWAEQLVAAVFAIHPGLPPLLRSIEAAREMACDAEALRHLRCNRKTYATLLVSFSTAAPPRAVGAVSIAETASLLKERIRAMTQLNMSDLKNPHYTSVLAGVLLLSLGLGIVACSDAVTPPTASDTGSEATAPQSETLDDSEVFVVVEDRPKLKGGMEALQERIQYPELAKKAGIEGRVFVQFVVSENGDVLNPTVTRGVHDALDQAALNAVKDLSFEPGRQRGRAVKVQMSLPVTFKLSDDTPENDDTSVFEKAGMQRITIALQPDGAVTVDGQPSRISELTDVVEQKLAATDTKAYVALKVSGDVTMETVNRVQVALRAANAERISYERQ